MFFVEQKMVTSKNIPALKFGKLKFRKKTLNYRNTEFHKLGKTDIMVDN